jgi:hypothetical protein
MFPLHQSPWDRPPIVARSVRRACEHVFVNGRSYSYLLGMYLGDGWVGPGSASAQLVVRLDARYPAIINECVAATTAVLPDRRVAVYRSRHQRCVGVTSYDPRWLELFPQWGKGPKHERPIVLADWQRAIVDEFPRALLRGLIHSDGCRTVNRFKTKLPSGRVAEYEYPRYFFSNLSADIRALFCEYCERLGIRWTQSNHRNISVSHRHSVAILDGFIGPKT